MKLQLGMLLALALCLSLPASAQYHLNNPNGLAFDSRGHLWVVNSGANQILELSPAVPIVLNTITQGIDAPSRLFFDSSGTLWVANLGNNTVTAYNNLTTPGGRLVKTVSNSQIQRPLGLAVDDYGDVFVANNSANDIIALNIADHLIESPTVDNSGFEFTAPGALAIQGQNLYAGFGSTSSEDAVISYNLGEFLTGDPAEITVFNDNVNTGPTGIAFDSAGNVYISEYYSGSWVKYAPAGGAPMLVVHSGVEQPEGIAVDQRGNIYVSNSSQNDITVYSPSGRLFLTMH